MKTLITFFVLITSFSFAQEYSNFKIENGKLVYEKVIQDSLSYSEAKKRIVKTSGEFINESENYFVYKFSNVEIDYKKYGYKWGNTATFLNYPQSGLITFETKENRYRIKVENLTFSSFAGQSLYGGNNENVDVDPMIINKKKNEIDSRKITLSALKIYDTFFTEIFKSLESDDNW